MSDQTFALSDAAARAAYAVAGHAEGGLLHVVPINGMEAPNVIDLSVARVRREEARKNVD